MRLTRTIISAWCTAIFSAAPGAVAAQGFNCAVVYDEFESLMNKRFLTNPDQFVRTLPGSISRQQFEDASGAGFLLYPGRQGMGVGILTTNQNIHAKFLFHWSQTMTDGTAHVIIDEVVKYGRVADGYAPSRIGPFRLRPGASVDIDTGEYVESRGFAGQDDDRAEQLDSGDLLYEAGPDGAVLKAVNGAQVQFPLDTMCQPGSS